MKRKNSYVCFSLSLANYLCEKGFRLNGRKINTNNPMHYVYYFDYNAEIHEAVKKYNQIKRIRNHRFK